MCYVTFQYRYFPAIICQYFDQIVVNLIKCIFKLIPISLILKYARIKASR